MTIAPELLEKLRQRSAADPFPGSSWACYAVMLRYVHDALQRVPSLEALDACTDDEMDLLLGTELEHLAAAVAEIFPGSGPEELVYYLKIPIT